MYYSILVMSNWIFSCLRKHLFQTKSRLTLWYYMFLTQWQVGFHLGFHRCKVASSILPQRNFRMSVQICKYVYVNEFRYVLTNSLLKEFQPQQMHILCPLNLISFTSCIGYNRIPPKTNKTCWSLKSDGTVFNCSWYNMTKKTFTQIILLLTALACLCSSLLTYLGSWED